MHVRRAQSLCCRDYPAASPFAIGDALAVRGTAPFTLDPALIPGHRTRNGTPSTLRAGKLATAFALERSYALAH
jgi:hypothetical protein